MKTTGSIDKKVDWKSSTNEARAERAAWLGTFRKFLEEVEAVGGDDVKAVFEKWNVKFADVDSFPRININEPSDLEHNADDVVETEDSHGESVSGSEVETKIEGEENETETL